jgi:hypothetical protein
VFFVFLAAMLAVLPRSLSLQAITPALLLAFGATAYRYLPFALLGGLPFLIARFPRSTRGQRMLAAMVAILVAAAFIRMAMLKLPAAPDRGVSTAEMPVALLGEAQRLGIAGNVFTTVKWGGYLAWQLGSGARPYIDGRYLMNTERLENYTHVLWSTPRGRQEFERAGFDWVLMPYRNTLSPADKPYALVEYLRRHPDWRMRAATEQGIVFSRTGN